MSCTCRTALSLVSKQRLAVRPTSVRSFTSTSSILAPASSPSSPPPPAAESTPPPSASSSISSCPEGTVLKGLNYLKDESPVVSKPDSEYPAWLWSLASDSASDGVAKKSKKSKKATGTEEEIKAREQVEELKRQKKSLKMEGRKAIKASNVLRG